MSLCISTYLIMYVHTYSLFFFSFMYLHLKSNSLYAVPQFTTPHVFTQCFYYSIQLEVIACRSKGFYKIISIILSLLSLDYKTRKCIKTVFCFLYHEELLSTYICRIRFSHDQSKNNT